MSIKTYQLYCEICGYKRITDGSDIADLHEIKTSPVPRGVPFLNKEGSKQTTPQLHGPGIESTEIVVPQSQKQVKKFKCPKCGRVITARKITTIEHGQKNNAS